MSILLDTHFHFYPIDIVGTVLRSTWEVMEQLMPGSQKVIFMTERFSERYMDRVLENRVLGSLHVSVSPGEPIAHLQDGRGLDLYLIQGRQVISHEGLEVLLAGTNKLIEDRTLDARSIIEQSKELGALAIIPWSFGKWLGKRGTLVKELIQDASSEFCLGDIWGRAKGFGGAELFQLAKSLNRTVVCGSDPLPVAADYRQCAGRYCSKIDDSLPDAQQWQWLKDTLVHKEVGTVGNRCHELSGLLRQAKLRIFPFTMKSLM